MATLSFQQMYGDDPYSTVVQHNSTAQAFWAGGLRYKPWNSLTSGANTGNEAGNGIPRISYSVDSILWKSVSEEPSTSFHIMKYSGWVWRSPSCSAVTHELHILNLHTCGTRFGLKLQSIWIMGFALVSWCEMEGGTIRPIGENHEGINCLTVYRAVSYIQQWERWTAWRLQSIS